MSKTSIDHLDRISQVANHKSPSFACIDAARVRDPPPSRRTSPNFAARKWRPPPTLPARRARRRCERHCCCAVPARGPHSPCRLLLLLLLLSEDIHNAGINTRISISISTGLLVVAGM